MIKTLLEKGANPNTTDEF